MLKYKDVYKYRYRHGLLGLTIGVPLLLVAVSGCLLALKGPIDASGLLGARDPWPQVYSFHRSLFAGWMGRVLISSVGVGLWGMAWTGRRSLVRLKGRKISVHARIGLRMGIPLALVTSLGAVLNFVEPLSDWLDPIPVIAVVSPVSSDANIPSVTPQQMERAHVTASRLHAPADLIKVYQPKSRRPYLLFYYADNTRLYIDPSTSILLKTRTSWSHWTSALLPLHALKPLGVLGTVILLALGVSLVVLTLVPVCKMLRALRAIFASRTILSLR